MRQKTILLNAVAGEGLGQVPHQLQVSRGKGGGVFLTFKSFRSLTVLQTFDIYLCCEWKAVFLMFFFNPFFSVINFH